MGTTGLEHGLKLSYARTSPSVIHSEALSVYTVGCLQEEQSHTIYRFDSLDNIPHNILDMQLNQQSVKCFDCTHSQDLLQRSMLFNLQNKTFHPSIQDSICIVFNHVQKKLVVLI